MEQIEPADAVEMYIDDRHDELASETIRSHRSRLKHWITYCNEHGIDTLDELAPMKVHRYKSWRRERDDINHVTLKTQLDTLRVHLKWGERLELVPDGVSDAVISPSLSSDDTRDEMLDPEVGEAILEYLETYEYASREHVTLQLIWHGLLRRGSLRAIDTDDVDTDGNPAIQIEHRKETGTPLKNKSDGDRWIAIKPNVAEIVNDHIDTVRHDVTDEHGREPLLTTSHGRPHRNTLQADVYAVTRPCAIGRECPHGKDPDACDAARDRQTAYECPSSVGPHAARRGAITHWLQSDIPTAPISSRANSDPGVIDQYYDRRTEREKAEQRREYLKDV